MRIRIFPPSPHSSLLLIPRVSQEEVPTYQPTLRTLSISLGVRQNKLGEDVMITNVREFDREMGLARGNVWNMRDMMTWTV